MDIRKNARLTPLGRALPREGTVGLQDGSSRPLQLHRPTRWRGAGRACASSSRRATSRTPCHGHLDPGARLFGKPFRKADLARAVRRALADEEEAD